MDRITLDQTTLGGLPPGLRSNLKTPAGSTAPTGDAEDVFIVNELRSMSVGTLTLDGQAGTDTYAVYTTGSQGAPRDYVINVLDTGAKDDGVDTLAVFGVTAPRRRGRWTTSSCSAARPRSRRDRRGPGLRRPAPRHPGAGPRRQRDVDRPAAGGAADQLRRRPERTPGWSTGWAATTTSRWTTTAPTRPWTAGRATTTSRSVSSSAAGVTRPRASPRPTCSEPSPPRAAT